MNEEVLCMLVELVKLVGDMVPEDLKATAEQQTTTGKPAWALAQELARKLGPTQEVSQLSGCEGQIP